MTKPKPKPAEVDRGPGPDDTETLVSVQDAPAVEPIAVDDSADDIDLEED